MTDSAEPTDVAPSRSTRREFLKILGATGAATAAIGCSSDRVERLIPYLVQPDETVPGVSNFYASTCRECSAACGVLLETRDGRTFKLEGNPDHPLNRGALCARGQAAVQGLYNPDRYRGPLIRRNGRLERATWDQALQLMSQRLGELQSRGQAGGAVFINRHETGSFSTFLDGWLAAFGMPPHLSYDALADTAVIAANRVSYGVSWPSLNFDAARLIVSFGADFLDTWGASVPQQLDFANARAKIENAPRFIYVGPRCSLTGLNADEWIACKPGGELAIVNALRGSGSMDQAAQASGAPAATLQRLANELRAAKPSMILAGGNTASTGELALAVNELNKTLGNVGVTVRTAQPVTSFDGIATDAELFDVVERMRAGQVPLLMVRGVNPVFTLPRSARVAEALAKVPFKVSFSSYPDETSELCDLVLPDNHPIESWGDAQPMPNVISLQQPGMDPVYDTRQTADVLIQLAKGSPRAAAQYPMPNFRTWLIGRYPGGVTAFTAAVQKGIGTGTLPVPTAARATPTPTPRQTPNIEQTSGDFYLVVYPSSALGDGSGANKPWLQELPDPVTKVCWQSWVEIHPQAAQRMGVDSGDILTIETAAGRVSAPAYVYLGVRPDTIAMAFGQGHTAYGRYAKGVGVNPGDVLPVGFDARSGAQAWTVTKVRVSKTGDFTPLVTTEGSARQHGRGIAQALMVDELGKLKVEHGAEGEQHAPELTPGGSEATPETRRAGAARSQRPQEQGSPEGEEHEFPGDASHEFLPGLRAPVAQDAQGELPSDDNMKGMYDPNHWSGMAKRRWAMTIDLARCTGCSACVTACYAENNIPTVGAPYQSHQTAGVQGLAGANILRSREMNWIRLERYWEGREDGSAAFEARFVPMLCQHCGNAPCEPVCPVYATYHSPDGLNVQVYNRCVGTRYCSNNCPYKVRYFNWFGYGEPDRPQYAWPERMNWQLNPDVNVRGKGVMEKCTFCVQRIREAESRAKLEGRPVNPDEFTVSCAQACPSRAITFGDAADPQWSVAKLVNDRRAYHVFEELNTYTAVVYLKKVNHPAPTASERAPAPTGA